MEKLLDEVVVDSDTHISDSSLLNLIWNALENTYSIKVFQKPSKYAHYSTVRQTTKEYMSGWLDCLVNIHSKPLSLVRFSMNLYFCHTPVSVWAILSHLRLALSKAHTMKIYNQASTVNISDRLNWHQHPTTAVIGADNMHYITHIGKPHINSEGEVQYTQVYNTINMWQLFHLPGIIQEYSSNFITPIPFKIITPENQN